MAQGNNYSVLLCTELEFNNPEESLYEKKLKENVNKCLKHQNQERYDLSNNIVCALIKYK